MWKWILPLAIVAGVTLCWCCTASTPAPVNPDTTPVHVVEKEDWGSDDDTSEETGYEGEAYEEEGEGAEEESYYEDAPAPAPRPVSAQGYGEAGYGRGFGRMSSRTASAKPRITPRASPQPVGSSDPLAGLEEATPPLEDRSSPLSLVDQVLESLDLGNLAFNTPEVMGYSETREVELLLSTKESPEELASALPDGPSGTAEGIRVAPEMEAALVGSGFSIEAVTPVRQAVSTLQRTRWAWTIKPKDKGAQTLHLTLSARIKVEGKDTPYVVQTFSREIKVEVTIWGTILDFFSKNWQWLWSTLLFPLALWWWKRRRRE